MVEVKILRLVVVFGLALLNQSFADTIVPPTTPFNQCPGTCQYLIVINPNNTTSLYYDGGYLRAIASGAVDPEDTQVGIFNNSSSNLLSISISSTNPESEFFDFDGGLSDDEPNFGYGPTGYEGPGISFILAPDFDHDLCQVQFTPEFCFTGLIQLSGSGLAPGGITYFALEGSAATDLGGPNGLTANGVTAIDASPVPEPASIMLMGSGLCALVGRFRRK
jgi:hypothetical protein